MARQAVLVAAAFLISLLGMPCQARAQASYGAEERGIERVKTAMELQSIKVDGAFGEVWAPYNGAVTFSVADVALPGNNQIPVEFRRTVSIRERRFWHPNEARMSDEFGGLDDWNVDMPMIYGMVSQSLGWQTTDANPYARCSAPAPPKSSSTAQHAADFWSGYRLNIPGDSNKLLLDTRGTEKLIRPQTGRTYALGTKDFWMVSCLPATKNGYPGEAFLVESPDGLRYYMDWVVTKVASSSTTYTSSRSPLVPNRNPLARSLVYFVVSRIEDRFGNYVNYSFDGSKLSRIEASDGRWISIAYSGNRVAAVDSSRGRWSYTYAGGGMLAKVVQPDGSAWTYQQAGRLESVSESFEYSDPGPPTCAFVPYVHGENYAYSVTNPSGATANFSFKYVGLSRDNIPKMCSKPAYTLEYWVIPPVDYSYALVEKTVSGAGLVAATWQYSYESGMYAWEEQCAAVPSQCAAPRVTTVVHPDRHQEIYEHGNKYNVNDGLLFRQRWVEGGVVLRELTNEYQLDGSGQPYPLKVGTSRMSYTSLAPIEHLQPVRKVVISQAGDQYVKEVSSFDAMARPITTRRYSPWYSRTDSVKYADALGLWVLGQIASSTNNDTGNVETASTFDGKAMPAAQWSFGNLLQEFTYHQDGNVSTVKDARGNVTALASWKLGLPQQISFADGTRKAFQVDDRGNIVSITDQNGSVVRYGYDAMGRISRIDQPVADSVAWNSTLQTFEQVAGPEYGLAAGHWRATVQTGSARKMTYFDALLRPVLIREFDAANESLTKRFQRRAFDIEGREIFESYMGDGDDQRRGVSSAYDSLGRLLGTVVDSELGDLVTLSEYLPGGVMRTTDARGHVTTVRSMAFDKPVYDLPVSIVQPEGASTDIHRDVFGKPLSITRGDAAGGMRLSRRYVYDSGQRLCKAIEPESGATISNYDAAGNLSWSAGGLNFADAAQCNREQAFASGRRIDRNYDSMNRLVALTFPDGQGNQQWSYTLDGKPSQILTSNDGKRFSNVYAYNKRGLITGETSAFVGEAGYSLGYGYDANGVLATVRYPTGMNVDYAPNALGQATRAGGYATDVRYYPDGAMRQFLYGNGIRHSMEQNARHLPSRSVDVGVLDLSTRYDQNGNTLAIREASSLPGVYAGNRDMVYDKQDRLVSVNMHDLMVESFGYDALDNRISGRRLTGNVSRGERYVYDASNRLTNVMDDSGATVTGLAYDLQGNLRARNGRQFLFDYGNRLRSAVGSATYQYDGAGRRVLLRDSNSNSETRSVYGHDGQLRLMSDGSTGRVTEYISLSGSLIARVKTAEAPATPTLTVPTVSDGNHVATWTAPRFATSYELQSSRSGGGWSTVFSGNALRFSVSSQPAGTVSYRVRAANAGTWGPWSATATVKVLAPAGSAPLISGASEAPGGVVTINWTEVLGATRYMLLDSVNGSAKQVVHNGAGTSKALAAIAAGSHSFTVQACNESLCWPESQALIVRAYYAPPAPVITVPSIGYSGGYTIVWSAVSGAQSYRLWESVDGQSWAEQMNANVLSRQYSGRWSGNYWYRVEACNGAGCGATSASGVVAVIYPPTDVPQMNVPAGSPNGVYTISWNPVGWATTYVVEERVNSGGWVRIHDEGATWRNLSGRLSGNYAYRVAACNAAGCSGWSAEAGVRVAIIPAVPAGLFVGYIQPSANRTDYTASWRAVAGATLYSVKSNGAAGCSSSTTYCSTSVNGRPNAGGFQVKACNDFVCSDWSSPVDAEDMR